MSCACLVSNRSITRCSLPMKTVSLVLIVLLSFTLSATKVAAQNVYVSSEKDDSIAVFTPVGKLLTTYKTCLRPRDMQFNLNQTRLLVLCGDSDLLVEIDMVAGTTVDEIPLGAFASLNCASCAVLVALAALIIAKNLPKTCINVAQTCRTRV